MKIARLSETQIKEIKDRNRNDKIGILNCDDAIYIVKSVLDRYPDVPQSVFVDISSELSQKRIVRPADSIEAIIKANENQTALILRIIKQLVKFDDIDKFHIFAHLTMDVEKTDVDEFVIKDEDKPFIKETFQKAFVAMEKYIKDDIAQEKQLNLYHLDLLHEIYSTI